MLVCVHVKNVWSGGGEGGEGEGGEEEEEVREWGPRGAHL